MKQLESKDAARFFALALNTSLDRAERSRKRGRCDPKHTTIPLYGYHSVGLGTFEKERAMRHSKEQDVSKFYASWCNLYKLF